jgi:hypothetical protein
VGHFKKSIERHPIIAHLREGKKKEPGWLQKEEAAALIKSTKVHLDPDEKSLLVKIQTYTQELTTLKKPKILTWQYTTTH